MSESRKMTAYAVLGVPPTATKAEITHAYRRKLRAYHPDVRSGASDSGADERLRQIRAAYDLLRDRRRRADYDRAANAAHKDNGPLYARLRYDVRL
jgi:curved DNA-binding protein CbpA